MVDRTGCPDGGSFLYSNSSKVYCCFCKKAYRGGSHGDYYCKTTVITGPGPDSWWAPGKEFTTNIERLCSEKNKCNDCQDFEKKE